MLSFILLVKYDKTILVLKVNVVRLNEVSDIHLSSGL